MPSNDKIYFGPAPPLTVGGLKQILSHYPEDVPILFTAKIQGQPHDNLKAMIAADCDLQNHVDHILFFLVDEP